MSGAARRHRRGVHTLPPVVAAFILVPFLVEAAVVFAPAIQGVLLSFTEWRGIGSPKAVGLQNFRELVDDPIFRTGFTNTVRWLVAFGGLSGLLGLSLALLLRAERRGVAVYRSLIFLPVIFSLVVTALVWRVLYAPEGFFNNALQAVGLGSWGRIWLAEPRTVLYALVVASLWRSSGYIMVLYLAGLKSICASNFLKRPSTATPICLKTKLMSLWAGTSFWSAWAAGASTAKASARGAIRDIFNMGDS